MNQAQNEEVGLWNLQETTVSHEIFVCKISSHECLHLALAMDCKTRTQRSSTVAVADGSRIDERFSKQKYGYNLGGIRDQRCQLSNLSRWLFSNMLSFLDPLLSPTSKKHENDEMLMLVKEWFSWVAYCWWMVSNIFCWCSPSVGTIQFDWAGTNHQASGDWLWKTRDLFRWFFKSEPRSERW